MLCLECGEELRSRLQLKHHLRKQHGRMTYEDYLVKHQHGGVRPTCACGCGRETTFQGKGFARLIQGHHTAELRSAQSARMKGKKLTQEHREAIGEALRKSDVAKASAAHRSKLMRDFYDTIEGRARRRRQGEEYREKYASGEWDDVNRRRSRSLRKFWSSSLGEDTKRAVGRKVSGWAQSEEGRRFYAERGRRQSEFYASEEGRRQLARVAQKIRAANMLPFDEVKSRLTAIEGNEKVELLTGVTPETYTGICMDVDVKCNVCDTVQTRTLNGVILAPRCMACDRATYVSQGEQQLAGVIRSTGVDVVQSDRDLISPYELDIVVPERRLAIEYHGLYWHSEANAEPAVLQYRTTMKRRLAEAKGYQLLTFFEDEWRDKPELVAAMVRYRLGEARRRLFARRCELVELSRTGRAEFFDENHIAGDVKARYAYGLTHAGELVAALSLRVPLTRAHRGRYEVARFAVMRDVAVVGGLSRLTKRALGQASIDGMCGLVTYADMRFSSCRGYQSSGYAPVRETQPRFWWTDFVTRRDRFSVRARDGMSQAEVARLERQCRIWGDVNHVYTIDA